MKKIGILGSGTVGKTLAGGFLKKGYEEIMVGSGHPEKISGWPGELGGALRTGTFTEAAAFGDIIVLAVKGSAAVEVLATAGDPALKGKIVIDACNPIADRAPEDGVLSFFTEPNTSLMEVLQSKHEAARFVKAFSCIGSPLMVDPKLEGTPTMFGCGNDGPAKEEVKQIVEQFGFEWADMGSAKAARAIEPLCMLWCIPGLTENRWQHAFKLLK